MIHLCNILTCEKMLSVKLPQYQNMKTRGHSVGGWFFYSQIFYFGIWPP